jgi:hypothetical protein
VKSVRAAIALLALSVFVLFLCWPARGQTGLPAWAQSESGTAMTTGQGGQGLMFRGQSRDPELDKLMTLEAKAGQEVDGLVAQYGRVEEAARAKLKEKLASALAKQFDAQQKRRDLELARVEARLKKLREVMRKRGEERKTIIDKRLDQLVREAEGLGWSPPPGLRSPYSKWGAGMPAGAQR